VYNTGKWLAVKDKELWVYPKWINTCQLWDMASYFIHLWLRLIVKHKPQIISTTCSNVDWLRISSHYICAGVDTITHYVSSCRGMIPTTEHGNIWHGSPPSCPVLGPFKVSWVPLEHAFNIVDPSYSEIYFSMDGDAPYFMKNQSSSINIIGCFEEMEFPCAERQSLHD